MVASHAPSREARKGLPNENIDLKGVTMTVPNGREIAVGYCPLQNQYQLLINNNFPCNIDYLAAMAAKALADGRKVVQLIPGCVAAPMQIFQWFFAAAAWKELLEAFSAGRTAAVQLCDGRTISVAPVQIFQLLGVPLSTGDNVPQVNLYAIHLDLEVLRILLTRVEIACSA